MPPMSTRSRILIPVLAVAGVGLVLVASAELLAAPLGRRLTSQALSSMEGVHGTFSNARVDLLARSYSVDRLVLIEDGARAGDPPMLTVERLEVHASARDLLRGKTTASVKVVKAKLAVRMAKGNPEGVPDPGAELRRLPPLRLARVELRDCEVLLTDATVSPSATLWVHDLAGDFDDLATRPGLAAAPGATFHLQGVIQRSGKLALSGKLDPLASAPTFDGEVNLRDLQLSEQYALIAPRTGLQIPEGTVSVTGAFQASGGRLRGNLQPVFNGIGIRSTGGNVLKTVEATLANAKLGAIPERFESSHRMRFDLPWTRLGSLWDELVNQARAAFLEAVDSAVAVDKPKPAAASPKRVPAKHRATR
jgi:hypothetical protein